MIAPDFGGDVGDEVDFCPLLFLGELVAYLA